MKIKLISLIAALTLIASCSSESSISSSILNSSEDNYVLKTISPAGAPTFAFYDQGANTESFVTDSTPANVSKELLGIKYDFVVFDSINGLKAIKKNSADFKLINIITGGNFYLVSYDLDENHIPSSNDTFVSFSENGLPDLVYKKLKSSYTGWSSWNMPDATYLTATSDVSKALINHQYNYYFIAEPSLFAAKKQLGENASKVKVVANLRATWELYSGESAIPQAGLFVRYSTYQNHEQIVKDYVNLLNNRKDVCVDNPILAKQTIDSWNSDTTTQQSRFGYASAVAYNVQKDGNNGLGIVKKSSITSKKEFINKFINKLDNPSYTIFSDNLFIE